MLLLSMFCTPLVALAGEGIAERPPAVQKRAMTAGYAKTVRLVAQNAKLREKLHGLTYSAKTPRLRSLAFELETEEHESESKRELASGETDFFGRKRTETVYTIAPEILADVVKLTAQHPDLADKGRELAATFSTPSTKPQAAALGRKLGKLIDSAPQENRVLVAQREKMQQAEMDLVGKLDAKFAEDLPKLAAAFEKKPPAELAAYARSLVHKLDRETSSSELRKESVSESHARGSASGQQKGIFGGDRGSFSASFQSDSHGDEVLPDGTQYKVLVKRATSTADRHGDAAAVSLVDSRKLAQMSVELALVTRVLERRAPELGRPLATWLSQSRIDFVGEHDHSTTVEMRRADSDVAQRLVSNGLVSPLFAKALAKQRAREESSAEAHHPLLDE